MLSCFWLRRSSQRPRQSSKLRVRVGDFGLAALAEKTLRRDVANETRAHAPVGSVMWMVCQATCSRAKSHIELACFSGAKQQSGLLISPNQLAPRSRHTTPCPITQAPETIRNGQDCTFQSDVYSFGIVLHELLSGQLPYKGLALEQVMFMVASNLLRPDMNGKSLNMCRATDDRMVLPRARPSSSQHI
jgi:serine/threonine protein kinase